MSDTLKSRTATSSLALIRRSLADMRAASAALENDESFEEIIRSAETLSAGIKRLSAYTSDQTSPKKSPPIEKSIMEIDHAARVLDAVKNGKCPQCGGLVEND